MLHTIKPSILTLIELYKECLISENINAKERTPEFRFYRTRQCNNTSIIFGFEIF